MIISETKNRLLIKEILSDKKMFDRCAFPTTYDRVNPDLNNIWILIQDDNKENIGLIELRKWTGISYEVHIMIKTKYQNSRTPLEASKAVIEYLRKNTVIRKLIAFVPINYIHVIKHCFKLGFNVCGQMDNAVIIKEQYRKLIIFDLDL